MPSAILDAEVQPAQSGVRPPKFASVPGEDRNTTRARHIIREWNRNATVTVELLAQRWMMPKGAVSYLLLLAEQRGDYVRGAGLAH